MTNTQADEQRYPPDVFILGAGFSQAAYQQIPTLLDLGEILRLRLLASPRYRAMIGERACEVLEAGRIPVGNLEMWLSSLAEVQPFMSPSEGSLNQALLQEISDQLVSVVAQAQEGSWDAAPSWLHRLLRLWHRRRATVLTFNYDTIVEQSMVQLDPPHDPGDLVSSMLTQLPRPAFALMWGGSTPVPTFRLLKLHGSLDWYWSPGDQSGDTLCRLTPGILDVDRRPALAGKVPFIVPPLAAKSPFYSLGVVRELWRTSANALQAANRIVVIGYSVPLTDLATTAMLSQAGHPGAEWHVVDPDGLAVRARLVQLGIRADLIQVHNSVPDWVDVYEADHCWQMTTELAGELLEHRNDRDHPRPILTRRRRSDRGIVQAIRVSGTQVILEAHASAEQDVVPAEYPDQVDLVEVLTRIQEPMPVSVRLDGGDGEHRVLGALNPETVIGWCPLEIQDVPTDPP